MGELQGLRVVWQSRERRQSHRAGVIASAVYAAFAGVQIQPLEFFGEGKNEGEGDYCCSSDELLAKMDNLYFEATRGRDLD